MLILLRRIFQCNFSVMVEQTIISEGKDKGGLVVFNMVVSPELTPGDTISPENTVHLRKPCVSQLTAGGGVGVARVKLISLKCVRAEGVKKSRGGVCSLSCLICLYRIMCHLFMWCLLKAWWEFTVKHETQYANAFQGRDGGEKT